MSDEIIGVAEAAKVLDVHPVTLRIWSASGLVPCAKVGGRWKYRRQGLVNWVRDQEWQSEKARAASGTSTSRSTADASKEAAALLTAGKP